MEIYSKKVGDITVLTINGDIDASIVNQLRSLLNKSIDIGDKKIIIDFDKVSYIDSGGVGLLISIKAKIESVKGLLILVNVKDNNRKVFELTNLLNFFIILDSIEDAIGKIKNAVG